MNRFRWAVLTAVIALAAVAVAPMSSVSAAQKSANPIFVYSAFQTTMTSWDPATDYSNELIAMQNMYDTLTRYDSQTGKVVPLLATSWSSAHDQQTWTFHLRHGVLFHTGRPMNAPAAKAAIERTITLNGGAAYIWGEVGSIDTPSAYTMVFHLTAPTDFPLITSTDYAAYIYDTKVAGGGNLATWFAAGHDAGTGPYTVQSYEPGQETELTLKAFSHYWGGWNGKHYKTVVFDYIPDATTAVDLAKAGQVTFLPELTPQLWSTFKGKTGYETYKSSSWENYFAMLNTASGPLQNLDVRKAVSYAIEYGGITSALSGAAVRTPGIVPPGLVGYNPKGPEYRYDPAKAKQLLAESGLKDVSLSLNYSAGDADEQIVATLMKSNLAAIGITLNIRGLQSTTRQAIARSTDLSQRQDIFLLNWYPDAPDAFSWFSSLFKSANPPVWNLSYYSNPTLDAQIAKVESLLATNPTAGKQLYYKIQDELYEAAVAVPLFDLNYERVLVGHVKGYVDNPEYANVVFVYNLTP